MNVRLISYYDNMLDSICLAQANMIERDPYNFVKSMTIDQKIKMIEEIFKSPLRGSLEFASFHFYIEEVSRALTHQLVRHRTFSFSQQSLRFFNAKNSGFTMPPVNGKYQLMIESTLLDIKRAYESLLAEGCAIQDARSILPTNIQTLISVNCNYRGLVDFCAVRFCQKSQGEIRELADAMKNELVKVEPFLASKLIPICDHEGRCVYNSIYDGYCQKGASYGGGTKERS
jgi:thymidylate synthase (FAD)